jgi:acetyl-CoA C-acetyltransferase
MAPLANGQIDFAVWGAVVGNLAYANLAREVWLEAKLDPHVPTFTTIMQCSTSMVGVLKPSACWAAAGHWRSSAASKV